MTDPISLNTHLMLWHSSPASIYPEVKARGIDLYREYIWCSMGPWMPIGFARKFTGAFILSCIALPRVGPDAFLWAETRNHPDGDPAEKTFDHGGGHSSETKLWTRLPQRMIVNIWMESEVSAILDNGRGGYIGPDTAPQTDIDTWAFGIPDFAGTCMGLFTDPNATLESRLHAAMYLRTIGLWANSMQMSVANTKELLQILCCPGNWCSDKVATAVHLLSVLDSSWVDYFIQQAVYNSCSDKHILQVLAYACFLSSQEEVTASIRKHSLTRPVEDLVASILRIRNTQGSDKAACQQLAASGSDVASILVDILLGLPLTNAVSKALIRTFTLMPVEVSTPHLIALLQRRRDVASKARSTINNVLSCNLPFTEKPLLRLAEKGHWHSRRAARQILLHHGSAKAVQKVKDMLLDDDTESVRGEHTYG
jgi:hypothetical protein